MQWENTGLNWEDAGFHCLIDDIGKGYSFLGLLSDLPIDELKIDSFFDEGSDRNQDLALVESTVELVKKISALSFRDTDRAEICETKIP